MTAGRARAAAGGTCVPRAEPSAPPEVVVPQRCVLVLPRPASSTRARTGSPARWCPRPRRDGARPLAAGPARGGAHPAGYRILPGQGVCRRRPAAARIRSPADQPGRRRRRERAAAGWTPERPPVASAASSAPSAPSVPRPRRARHRRAVARPQSARGDAADARAAARQALAVWACAHRGDRAHRPLAAKATRRRADARTCTTRWPTWASRSALDLARRDGGRPSTTPATSTSTPATSPDCRDRPAASSRRHRARLGAAGGAGDDGQRPYAEVMAQRFGVPLPLDRPELLLPLRAAGPAAAALSRALGPRARTTRVVLYQGGFSRDRGIEQLIEAIPSVARAVLVLLGYGSLQAELTARPRNRRLAGRLHVLPAVPPTRAARLGRLGRRRRDADPADDPEPPPDDAQQAVRGDGRRRAGRRERSARDGRDRPRDRLRPRWSIPPSRGDRRRDSHDPGRARRRSARALRRASARRRPCHATTGNARWSSCWRSTGG